jgi:hypothetical protein
MAGFEVAINGRFWVATEVDRTQIFLMEQVLGILFAEGLVGLEHVTQDGMKIRAQASKRSFLDRRSSSQGRSNNNAMPDPWM